MTLLPPPRGAGLTLRAALTAFLVSAGTSSYGEGAPVLSASKVVAPVSLPGTGFNCGADPAHAEAEIMTPGTCVEYRVDVSSADNGAPPADDLEVMDTLPVGLSFVAIWDHAGFDTVSANTDGTISARRASMPAGSAAYFRIRALID